MLSCCFLFALKIRCWHFVLLLWEINLNFQETYNHAENKKLLCIIIYHRENLEYSTESEISTILTLAEYFEGLARCVTPPLKDANGACLILDLCPLDYGDT